MEQYYTLKEVSDKLGICIKTLYNWRDRGLIKFQKLGHNNKVAESEIQRVLKELSFEANVNKRK